MQAERFLTHSLKKASWGHQAAEIMAAALNAVDPYQAVRAHLQLSGNALLCCDHHLDLSDIRNIYVVGAGKAGLPMARGVADVLGDRISAGLVIVKEGYADVERLGNVDIRQAGHPLPDERGVQATRQILELVSQAGENDLVMCVISGGGSALLTAPIPGFSLDDLRQLTDALLARGAAIEEINTLRKQLDLVKGGGLARAASPAGVISLILSDVVGDPLGMIASGPTVPDHSTKEEAIQILERYDLLGFIPERVFSDWESSPAPDRTGDYSRVTNLLVGSNSLAAAAAVEQARHFGINALVMTTEMEGEAREAGVQLAGVLREMAEKGLPFARPAMLVAGGETTVTLQGNGIGGRNQELALAAVHGLDGLQDAALITLATDGGDGSSSGAGAVATGETFTRAAAAGLKSEDYLANNDSDAFFRALDDQIVTGPTQTNVNDLTFLFTF